jgi:hypothetical protein
LCLPNQAAEIDFPITTTLYLSPQGNDNHSGLSPDTGNGLDGPLKTIHRALDRIRQLREEGLCYVVQAQYILVFLPPRA